MPSQCWRANLGPWVCFTSALGVVSFTWIKPTLRAENWNHCPLGENPHTWLCWTEWFNAVFLECSIDPIFRDLCGFPLHSLVIWMWSLVFILIPSVVSSVWQLLFWKCHCSVLTHFPGGLLLVECMSFVWGFCLVGEFCFVCCLFVCFEVGSSWAAQTSPFPPLSLPVLVLHCGTFGTESGMTIFNML